ncbi:flagellar hook-length control protein FliK [Brevundimonas bullata]|uniref:flagellar hook-length control protein FliK n=1 Tax=Brevundimonas bullata TaxID=13160 RepID=UPI003D9A9393
MSALSVMSLIAPTAPVGASASVETAADSGLFASLVAAVAPSLKTQGEDSAPILDAPLVEDEAAETPSLDAAMTAAPAWPHLPLIAPAPLPVTPSAPATASEVADGATAASSAAPSPQIAPVTPLNVATNTPPNITAPIPPVDEALTSVPASTTPASLGTSAAEPDTAKTPIAPSAAPPAAPLPAAAQIEARPAQPASEAAPRPAVAAETPVAPAQNAVQVDQTVRQAAAAPRPAPTAAPAASTSPDAAPEPMALDGMTRPRPDSASARPVSQGPTAVTMTATSVPASPPAPAAAPSVQSAPEAPSTPALAPVAKPVAPTASAIAAAPVATPAPRPTAAAGQPAVSAQPTSQATELAPTTDAAEPAEQALATAAASVSSEAEPEPAPQTPPPATTAPAPARNGSARLDDRRSNAATANAPAEARTDTGGARSILPTSTPSAAASTAPVVVALSEAAAAPVLPADAAPLDGQADLAPSQQILDAQSTAPTAPRDLGLSQLSRATVETTAQLAAQILKKLEGRSTRFDMALSPEGLGRVDVSLEIDSDGRLAARLAFDNPAAATDMRARADELRRQLQDAGFQLTQDSLEFSDRNPSSGFSGGGAFDRAPDRRAFAGAARLAAQADTVLPPPGAWTSLSMTPDRVDMKV